MVTYDELIKIMQDSVDDPMWANHAEVPKRLLRTMIGAFTILKVENDHLYQELVKIKELTTATGGLVGDDAKAHIGTTMHRIVGFRAQGAGYIPVYLEEDTRTG